MPNKAAVGAAEVAASEERAAVLDEVAAFAAEAEAKGKALVQKKMIVGDPRPRPSTSRLERAQVARTAGALGYPPN